MSGPKVLVCASTLARLPAAQTLANQLKLSCIVEPVQPKSRHQSLADNDTFLLMINDDGHLDLRKSDQSTGALHCDFVQGRLNWKRLHGDLGNSELIKACTLPRLPISSTHVVDGTAGLGSDSFMLASRGFHVIAIERNPIVFALLNDGIARAQQADGEVGEIARRIQVIHADSRLQFSQLLDPKPHVVFLDPMYPSPPNQRKQALPKKGMQYLRQIVGSDPDDVESMVEAALNGATRRVILKRPTHAPQELLLPKLGVLKPTHSYTGTRHRFDAFSTSTV